MAELVPLLPRPKGLPGIRAHAARKAEQEAQGGEESGGGGGGEAGGGEAGGGEAGGGEGGGGGGHAAAAAVLAADPPDENGVPRSQAQAKRAADQRWGRTQQQRYVAEGERRVAEQEQMGLQRVWERDAREAEPEAPGAARLAGAESSCDPLSLGVEQYGGGIGGGRGGVGGEGGGGRGEGGGGKSSGGGGCGGDGGGGEGGGGDADSALCHTTTSSAELMVIE